MRTWLLIGGVLAAALAIAGILGGTLLAQRASVTTDETYFLFDAGHLARYGIVSTTKDDVYARAAAKLGVDAQALEDALTEAWDEVRAEREADAEQRLRDRLDALVEDGKFTREEADEWLDWLLARPGDGDSPGKRWGGWGLDKDWDCEVEVEKDDRAFGLFCGKGGWVHPPFGGRLDMDRWPPEWGERFGTGRWDKRFFHFGIKPDSAASGSKSDEL